MSRFVVKFMKVVLGANGHEENICQGCVEVDAKNKGAAAVLAKQKFCRAEGLVDWSLHADKILVQEAEFPS